MSRILIFFVLLIFSANDIQANSFKHIKGVYLPSQRFTKRKMTEINYYSDLSGLNGVVLHAKDPRGMLHWNSKNTVAIKIGAIKTKGRLKRALNFFKSKGKWTIAKIDVFSDSIFASNVEGAGVLDNETGEPWKDRKGLSWSNPCSKIAWDYNIDLSLELVKMGFDEIQFDYIRFPSDGELSRINIPNRKIGFSKSDCLKEFLKRAHAQIKPTGAIISIDLFGLTAWKKGDFGVGQVLEKITPYVDVVCPMFYPSHFPKGFYRLEEPSLYPHKIMLKSMQKTLKRTDKVVRPWIQGFWYSDTDVNEQINAVNKTGDAGWLVWNPTGNYSTTYFALEKRAGTNFPPLKFYPELKELLKEHERVVTGKFKVINYTNFRDGFSILSLEKSKGEIKTPFSKPVAIIQTLEEAIVDRILNRMNIKFGIHKSKYVKSLEVAKQMCRDIDKDPSKMRTFPIFIDWKNNGFFSLTIPEKFKLVWKEYKKYILVQSEQAKKRESAIN
ncbi:MAG: hypothetical protein GY714_27195 [Desulfobacterales bacterium]|nr:hypothetical protein [Desulfobacterales bacterium]MCP4160762.1 hypothetical protein [Deltaproteobacteria bacterium]